MKTTAMNRLNALTLFALGLAVAAIGTYVYREVTATAPLFAQAVPSVPAAAAPAKYQAAVERARTIVRSAVSDQNLPGVSVAAGVGLPSEVSVKEATVVWAEGFGWRDVGTRTPVTPDTRFNIGTAASAVADGSARLGLSNTGAEPANVWSPEAIGEEGEDFPPLALLRHHILQPLGIMSADYPLPGDRATFYVPRSDDADPRRGRRLMYMRDLACCAEGKTFYSTPSDLVRFALATNAGSVNGKLAGGLVMSLTTARDTGIVVAVTSNMAHAQTSSLAARIEKAFAGGAR
jgi:CubicO group peptidase (beta-lactamase class C family)